VPHKRLLETWIKPSGISIEEGRLERGLDFLGSRGEAYEIVSD
jgi:hypothetical protein